VGPAIPWATPGYPSSGGDEPLPIWFGPVDYRAVTQRVVITSLGSYGDVFPYVGIGLGLAGLGYDVRLAMPAFYRETVESVGLGFHAVRPDVDPRDTATIRRIMDPSRGTDFLIENLILPSLHDSFDDLRKAIRGADLLVTHPITFAGPILAQLEKMPWVSTVLAPMSFFSPHDLPVFPPAPWTKRLEHIPGVARGLVAMTRLIARRWSEPVSRMRRELGLPPGGDPVFEGQHSPRIVLGLFSRVLAEPQRDWPANVRITGAIPYNGRATSLTPVLQAFLDAGEAPVVFTLGSSAVGAAGDFYRQSVAAVTTLGVRAVLLVGSHAENRLPEPLQVGVFQTDHAPHATLFPRASAIVHQAGAGTLHQALRAGRPSLLVPFAHDQPDNAYRVERLGVARTIPAGRYSSKKVEKNLALILEDGEYRRRAEAVADRVRAENAVENACAAIQEVLQTPTSA
jgi:rhamnosyltransferase subunit B